jgi:hypothetical protein
MRATSDVALHVMYVDGSADEISEAFVAPSCRCRTDGREGSVRIRLVKDGNARADHARPKRHRGTGAAGDRAG